MSQRIEGLFLRATKIKHNSIIVDLLDSFQDDLSILAQQHLKFYLATVLQKIVT